MLYQLPFPDNIEQKTSRPSGIYAHENFPESKYAVDFLIDVGTPILAARSGCIWKVKEDSDKWGLNPQFASKANFVAIDHEDGTYAEYIHLKKNSIVVSVGQDVLTGDLLGYSGLSGCMDFPHLHFNVFKIENGKGVSIPFDFSEK